MGPLESVPTTVSVLEFSYQICTTAIRKQLNCYFARFLIFLPVFPAPKRPYSIEDFSELINSRLLLLEKHQEARQHYGNLLAVLRQQIDAYRNEYRFPK